MKDKEIEKVLEELQGVRPEELTGESKRLFEAIMKIADERDKAKADLYEANNCISDLLDVAKQREKIIDEILKTWKQDDVRSIEELREYFEERCK